MRHTWLQLGNKWDDLVTTYTQYSYCYHSPNGASTYLKQDRHINELTSEL